MIKKQNKRVFVLFTCFSAAIIALLVFGGESCEGALKGIRLCLGVLVPSLFSFTALSVFAAESGLSEHMGRTAGKAFKILFNVSENLSAVMIMSLIGGYPVGARGIAALRKRGAISDTEAQKAALITVGAGPGFLITYVGNGLLGYQEIGVCMLSAQIISVIILGNLNRIVFRDKEHNSSYKEINSAPLPLSNALTESITSAVYAMLEMSGMVIAFSVVLRISERFFGQFNVYICMLLEVSSACEYLSRSNNIILIAFAVGFGGVCVHFQVFAALKDIKLKKRLFFLYRIIQSILTALITSLLIKVFNISLPVFSSVKHTPELALSASAVGGAMLIICGLSFIYSIKNH